MLSPQVRQIVEQSKPTEDVAFLVLIDSEDEMARAADISDMAQRNHVLDALFQRIKQPLVATLAKYERDGVRIIDDLDGTPQMIVSGPARVWRRMIRENTSVLSDPKVEFFTNEPDWHLID